MNTELDKASIALQAAVSNLAVLLDDAQHGTDKAQRVAKMQLLAAAKEVQRWMVQVQNHIAMMVSER